MEARIRALWEWLTAPHQGIREGTQRRQAHLLATLSLLMLLLCILGLITTPMGGDFQDSLLVILALLVIAYLLSRRKSYLLGAAWVIATASFGTFWLALQADGYREVTILNFLWVPLLLTQIFFSTQSTLLLGVIFALAVLAMPWFFPQFTLSELFQEPFYFLVTTSLFLLIVWRHLKADENERQQELMGKEERYRTLLETTFEGICVSTDGVITDVNPGFVNMFGYEPNEVLGKPILEVFSETLKPLSKESAQDLPSYATPLRKKDGTLIYVETLSRLQNYRGQVVQVMAFRNVTDRVHAEHDLRRQRALLDEILNGVQEGVAIVDEQQRIAFCNPAFAELLDAQPNQLMGQSLMDYVDEWARHSLQHQLTLGKSGQVARREVPLLTAKGNRKVLHVTTSQRLTAEGEHKGVFMAAIDITERVRTEQALDRSERLYRALFEHANDAILLLNLEGVYIAANPKAADLFGCPMSEVIGKSIKDFTLPEEYEGALQVHKAVLDGAITPPYECNLLRKDGSRLSVEVNVSLVRDPSGKPLYIQDILRDISERQQREKRIRLQVQRLKAIRDIDRAITSSLDLRQTIDVLLAQTVKQLNVDAADILLYNPQEQTLEVAFRRGFHTGALRHTHLKLGEGYAGRAALEQRIIYVPNLAETPGDLSRATLLAMEGFSTYYAVPLIAKGQLKGVLEIFCRTPLQPDPEWEEFLESLASQAAIAIDNAELFRDLQRSNEELMQAYEFTLEGWAKALELRDRETEGHCQRVTETTLRLGQAMGMGKEELVDLRRGALLHDIGKMGIPDSILLKRGPLSEEEWETMRQHPIYAYQMLSTTPYLRRALDIPYCHHEKWDGSGYPRGLKGEEIPLAARIFAVVDAWDALNTNRPYRRARSKEAALEEIRAQAGKHFDPKVVETFFRLIQEEG